MGRPKALLDYRGETFLDRLIRLFSAHGRTTVVLGAGADAIRAGIERGGEVDIVVNPDYARGQISSMQCGLRALDAEADAVLFTLVDHPAVSQETVAALAGDPAPRLRIPRYQGRRGHPIVFQRETAREFLALSGDATARDVVHRHLHQAEFLDLDDAGIVADIDDEAAYRALLGGVQ